MTNSKAMTLWRDWIAVELGTAPADEDQAIQRLDQVDDAIINLDDGTLESTIVKLAISVNFNGDYYGDGATVLSAYNDLKAITGLDPIAELEAARA